MTLSDVRELGLLRQRVGPNLDRTRCSLETASSTVQREDLGVRGAHRVFGEVFMNQPDAERGQARAH